MIKLAFKTTAVAALLSTTSAMAATSGWVISEASGNVVITRDGKTMAGKKGARLDEGDLVQTASKSRAVLVRGSEYVVVSPKAKLKIAEPEKAGQVTQIFQYLGNALFKIEKKSKPHFGVETPYMAAVVKGTTFNVFVSEEGTSVQVTEGAVEVITADDLEAALLTPGIVGVVEAGRVEDLVVIVSDNANVNRDQIITRGNPNLVGGLSQIGNGSDVDVSVSEGRGSNSDQSSRGNGSSGAEETSGSNVDLAFAVPEYRDDVVTDGGFVASGGQEEDGAQDFETDFVQDPAIEAEEEPDDLLVGEQEDDGDDEDVEVDPKDDFDDGEEADKDDAKSQDEDDDEGVEQEIEDDESSDDNAEDSDDDYNDDNREDDDSDDDAEEDEDGSGQGVGLGNGNGLGNDDDDTEDGDDDDDDDDYEEEDDRDEDEYEEDSDDEDADDDEENEVGNGPGNGLGLGLGNGNGNGLALGLGLGNDDDQSAPDDDGEDRNGPGNGRGLGLGNGNGLGLGLGLGNGDDEYTEFDEDEVYGGNQGRGRGRGRGNAN